jgi:hypothetical protein
MFFLTQNHPSSTQPGFRWLFYRDVPRKTRLKLNVTIHRLESSPVSQFLWQFVHREQINK